MERLKRERKPVSPDALKLVMLDEISGRLADLTEVQQRILTHLEEITAEGIDFPISDITVTEATTINFLKQYPYRRIRSLDPVFNKGPNTAYIRVNEEAKEIPIEDREDIQINRPKATIEYITIRVAPGKPTTIRMIGHY